MCYRAFILICVVLFTPLHYCHDANANVVNDITINGLKRVGKDAVLSALGVKIGDDINKDALHIIITKMYRMRSFMTVNAKVSGDKLIIDVVEGPSINNVIIIGTRGNIKDAILNTIETRPMGSYNKAMIHKDIGTIKAIHQNLSRYNTSVIAKVSTVDQDIVDIIFEIKNTGVSKVQDVIFIGNHYIPTALLMGILKTQANNLWSKIKNGSVVSERDIDTDSNAIMAFYRNKGFLRARIVKSLVEHDEEANKIVVTFIISEGKKYSFGTTSIKANSKFINFNELDVGTQYDQGDCYRDIDIENMKNSILYELHRKGFAMSDVNYILNVDDDTNKVNVEYVISDTPRTYIRHIFISGNSRTHDHVIRREMIIKEGDLYVLKDVQRTKARLTMLGIFENIDISLRATDRPDMVDMMINLSELPSATKVQFNIGYSSFEKFVLSIGIEDSNLLGLGYLASINTTISGLQKALTLSFSNNRIFDSNIGFNVSLEVMEFGSAAFPVIPYIRVGASISMALSTMIFDLVRAELSLSYQGANLSLLPNQNIRNSNIWEGIIGDYSSFIFGQSFAMDRTDHPLQPSKGMILSFSQAYSGLFGVGTQNYIMQSIRATFYVPLFAGNRDWVFCFGVNGGIITGLGPSGPSAVDFINRFNVGYQSMRGFSFRGIGPRIATEDANGNVTYDSLGFGGNRFIVGTIELLMPTPFPKQYGFRFAIFTDFGTLLGIESIDRLGQNMDRLNKLGLREYIVDSASIRMAVGFGLIWVSPLGPLRIDIAYPVLKESYDNAMNFRLLFSASPTM